MQYSHHTGGGRPRTRITPAHCWSTATSIFALSSRATRPRLAPVSPMLWIAEVGSTKGDQTLHALLVALGERLRDLRRKRGWTQQDLGDAAALDRTYVIALEKGRQNLTLGTIFRIAQALDAPLEQILFTA